MKSEKNKGRFLIFFGIVFIFAALLITGYNLWVDHTAGKSVNCIVENIDDSIPVNNLPTEQPKYILNPDMEMPVITIDGIDYIGKISISSLDIELPVTSEWSYDNLADAVCRYDGSIYQNNMIIAGHNYASLFKNLKRISVQDEIAFTDIEGNVFYYNVIETEILKPVNVEEMKSGDWDLTLFTCTSGGRARLAVRCERVNELF